MLVFGFQGFDHTLLNVVALYASETATHSGNSSMKFNSHPRNRIEGLAPIAAAGPNPQAGERIRSFEDRK